jgi:sulfite exporter TauE/SafE
MNLLPMLSGALALGFLGSFHCIGMCGPIALALPVSGKGPAAHLRATFLYNSGRVLTYAALGALFGLLGKTLALAGGQRVLSISLGLLLVVIAVLPEHIAARTRVTRFFFGAVAKVKSKLSALFRKRTAASLFAIGLLNGLLPCGLVYAGLAGAAATGELWKGAVFMAVFGAGTAPVMLMVPLAGKFITVPLRNKLRKAVPVFIVAMGLLLVLRGLNLGIPYLSPDLTAKHSCCHY